jgi:hypothetical protein
MFGIIAIVAAVIAAVVVAAVVLKKALADSKKDADENFSDRPVGGEEEPCPLESEEEDPKLVSVEFLDGKDDVELSGTGKQFVNVSRDAKWVDGSTVKNIDRTGYKPRFKVKFNKPGSHSFKVKFVPDGDNMAYTDAEKGRNDRFKYLEEEKSYTTDGDGTKIVEGDFYVAAGAGHKYKLEAKDDFGNSDTSNNIEVNKLIYLQEIKMKDLATIASSLSTLTGEYVSHGIVMKELGSLEIDHMPNIGSTADTNTLKSSARGAYGSSGAVARSPYVIAVAYTDHLAVKNSNKQLSKSGVQVGPGKPKVTIPVRGIGLRAGDGIDDRALWQDIVPGEGWFVSAKYLKNGDTAGVDDVDIPAEKCTPGAGTWAGNDKYRDSVDIDVTDLPAGTGSITITVNWVDRMRAGLASSGNLVIICTRSWWQNKSAAAQNEVMIHEIGHMVGMVADGTGKLPDKPAKHYVDRGHVGNHCHHGLALRASFSSGSNSGSDCVMFGSTNGKSAFCSDCQPAVRKVDISAGWSRF